MSLPGMTQLNDSPAPGGLREVDLDRLHAERAPAPAEASSEILGDDYPRMPRRRRRPDNAIARGVIWWSVIPTLVALACLGMLAIFGSPL